MKIKTKLLGSILSTTSILAASIPLASCAAKSKDINTESVNNLSATGYCKITFSAGTTGATITGTKSVQVKKNKMFGTVKQPVATLANKKFICWTDSTTNKDYTSSTPITNGTTLYPKFEAEQITVTFDAAGGECTETTKIINSGSAIGELPTPTREGYTFNGWFQGSILINSESVFNNNATIVAHWNVIETVSVALFSTTDGATFNGQTSLILKFKKGTTFGEAKKSFPTLTYQDMEKKSLEVGDYKDSQDNVISDNLVLSDSTIVKQGIRVSSSIPLSVKTTSSTIEVGSTATIYPRLNFGTLDEEINKTNENSEYCILKFNTRNSYIGIDGNTTVEINNGKQFFMVNKPAVILKLPLTFTNTWFRTDTYAQVPGNTRITEDSINLLPELKEDSCSFISSDSSITTVDSTGIVTRKASGQVTITITNNNNPNIKSTVTFN